MGVRIPPSLLNMKTENEKPRPGDLVEVFLVKDSYKGIFLESPENEKGIVLLKISSGYNIGINRKNILDMKVLKRAEEKKEKTEIKKDREKPNIAMIVTGGTISSELDSRTGAVKWLTSPEKLFRFYPEIFEN